MSTENKWGLFIAGMVILLLAIMMWSIVTMKSMNEDNSTVISHIHNKNQLILKIEDILNSINTNEDFLVYFEVRHYELKHFEIKYQTKKKEGFINESSNN